MVTTFKLLSAKLVAEARGTARGGRGLDPIRDVLGREIRGRIGSEAERKQTQEANRIFREQQARQQQEAQRQTQVQQQTEARVEQQRVQQLRQQFVARGGQVRTQQFIQQRTGQPVQVETVRGVGGAKIITRRTPKGVVTTRTFDVQRRQTGGIEVTPIKSQTIDSTMSVADITKPSPTTTTFLERQREKPFKLGVRSVISRGVAFASYPFEKGLQRLPEKWEWRYGGSFKESLLKPRRFDVSDPILFAGASPFMQSAFAVRGDLLASGSIKPVTKTAFVAEIEKGSKGFSRVAVISKTDVGGVKITGASQQLVKSSIDDVSFGVGKGFVKVPAKAGVTDIKTFSVLSKGQALKGARIGVADDLTKVTFEAGQGLKTTSLIKTGDTLRIDKRLFSLRPRRVIPEKIPTIFKQEVIGAVKPVKGSEDIFKFIGSKSKPTFVIKQTGTALKAPVNIRGLIKTTDISKQQNVFEIIGGRTSGLTPPLQKSVTSQVGTVSAIAEQKVVTAAVQEASFGTLTKPLSTSTLAAPTTTTRTETKAITDSVTSQVLVSKPKSTLKVLQVTKQKQRPAQRVRQPQSSIFKQPQKEIQKLRIKTDQLQRQQQLLKQPLKLKLKQGGIPGIPTVPVSVPVPKVPIPFVITKPKKSPIISKGLFGVQVRRRGVFKTIGKGLSLKKALSLGKGRVSRTLAASFKLTGGRVGATPKGFRLSKKERGVIIEKRSRRIKKRGVSDEVAELAIAKKKMKGILN